MRDKIPSIIKARGTDVEMIRLKRSQFLNALKKKLFEEVKEFNRAKSKKDIINELSDILEIVECIAKEKNISVKEIKRNKQKKRMERGSFDKRIFLKYIKE